MASSLLGSQLCLITACSVTLAKKEIFGPLSTRKVKGTVIRSGRLQAHAGAEAQPIIIVFLSFYMIYILTDASRGRYEI